MLRGGGRLIFVNSKYSLLMFVNSLYVIKHINIEIFFYIYFFISEKSIIFVVR